VRQSRRRIGACAGVVLALLTTWPMTVAAQQLSVWLDGNAAHSRPPAGAAVEAASYGLLGLRLRADGRGSAFDLAGSTGRGAQDGSGAWLNGRAALSLTRVRGAADFGVRAEGTGLTYLAPLRLDGGTEYRQSLATGTAAPFAGISIGGFRIGAEGTYTRGAWRSQLTAPGGIQQPPLVPLPGTPAPGPGGSTVHHEGDVVIAGGAVSLLRVLGAATFELRATGYDVTNAVADGLYAGVDGTIALSAGAFDVTAGVGHWQTPAAEPELGGHVGVGVALGSGAYLQATASRSVTDALHGTAGGASFSAGVSMRVGQRRLGPPAPITVGAPTPDGRRVLFTLDRRDARSVAVAGDFSGWEPRPLVRGANGTWTLETVIPPGVYHYSFIIDGETWLVPEHATGIVDDGFGQKNATLIVDGTDDR
jgi:hypothetical protein